MPIATPMPIPIPSLTSPLQIECAENRNTPGFCYRNARQMSQHFTHPEAQTMRILQAALVLLFIAAATQLSAGQAEKPLLLREPSISRTQIAFAHAGDIWIVSRDGGEARRLTTSIGIEANPVFSPDGTQIAFTGEYDGNQDVYVMPASGGVPRRLTYNPGPDSAVGWTPDGKQVLFSSTRSSFADG